MSTEIHRRNRLLACATCAIAAAAAQPAAASEKLDSFAGSCAVEVQVFFSPPATNFQQSLDVTDEGRGTCSGQLNGTQVEDAPVTMKAAFEDVDGSCLRARTTKPGAGSITFADGTTIRLSVEFDFVGTEGELTLRGERSGSGSGHGTFMTERTPPDIALKCAGEGTEEAPLDITFATDEPFVSARAGDRGEPQRRPGGKKAGKPMRVRACPRRADAGRRTTFTFVAARRNGRPVRGASVRFAGRHARTGTRGRARIVAALPRPGRWKARVRRRGFRPARVTIEARATRPARHLAG